MGSLMFPWLQSGFPVIHAVTLQKNIEKYINKYLSLKKSQFKDGPGYVRSRLDFTKTLRGMISLTSINNFFFFNLNKSFF